MSILIKGMEMPKKCAECPFVIKSNSPKYPFVDCKIIGRLGSVFNCIGIPVDCPLVELPPHGRLIDANALTKMCREMQSIDWNKKAFPYSWEHAYEEFENDIDEAPTIIEAEVDGG